MELRKDAQREITNSCRVFCDDNNIEIITGNESSIVSITKIRQVVRPEQRKHGNFNYCKLEEVLHVAWAIENSLM